MKAVFGDAVVVEVDGLDGVRSVRGMAPGPAGAATMDVGEGVSLSVDFADPSVLCAIELEPEAGDAVLPVLLGAGRAAQASTATAGGVALRVEGGVRASARMTSLPDERPAHELAVVTSLVSLAADPRRVPLARVANAAEVLAALANGVRGLADVAAIRRRMEHVMADASAVAHDDATWLATHDRTLARRLADLLERVHGERADAELVSVLRASRGSSRSRRGSSSSTVASRSVGADGGAATGSVTSSAPYVEQRPGRVSATLSDGRGKWLRVADSSTMVLHAVVPFVECGSEWRADAVVAPDLPPERVLSAVTVDPVPAGVTTLGRMRQAIALGRRAVEQAQTGQMERAVECWRECEEAWRALGDEARAARAADYAARRARPGRPTSLGERINISVGRQVPESDT